MGASSFRTLITRVNALGSFAGQGYFFTLVPCGMVPHVHIH
jgi:hypothetical protein